MSYRDYVTAAYAIFATMLLWDYLAPRLQLRSALRQARLRLERERARGPRTEARP